MLTSEPESSAPGPVSADFDARNIIPEGTARSRTQRQKYAAALLQKTDLTAFHTSFAHGLSVGGAKSEGQHRDTLPPEPQNWRQMIKHRFSRDFRQAVDREIQEL